MVNMNGAIRRVFNSIVEPSAHKILARLTFARRSCSAATVTSGFKDTIYALSSGHGKCGVAVIRVSGRMSSDIIKRLGGYSTPPAPREALLRTLVDPRTRRTLDSALVLWFPAPRSFTGEDCLELQVHGGLAVVSAVMETLSSFPETRPALAGEFTKRAFINGKLSLTQVEGLADVIHAETEVQRRQAVRQMSGQLSQMYNQWRSMLIKVSAAVEAYIDFSEEENIEDDVIDATKSSLADLSQRLRAHLNDGRRGEILRNGVRVAIVGRPNAGKSSLLNLLSRRQAAIVSHVEGTTRDVIETSVDVNGYPAVLLDTAGIRQSADEIEQEGVRRAIHRSQEADLVVIMVDVMELAGGVGSLRQRVNASVSHLLSHYLKLELEDKQLLVVVNKTDLFNKTSFISDEDTDGSSLFSSYTDKLSSLQQSPNSEAVYPVVFTSLTQSAGIDDLMTVLTSRLKELCGDPLQGSPSYTQARHRDHLSRAVENVDEALRLMDADVVIAAESLRLACAELGHLTGVISSEEILDVVFRDFCIGK